jgi:hypothetical protein
MGTGFGSEAEERQVDISCQRVERLLRVALSDWYGYLSRESLVLEAWRYEIPWWVKKVPERLDCDWAMSDLKKSLGRVGLLSGLVMVVDELMLAMKRDGEMLNHPPEIEQLHIALQELSDVLGI